MRNEHTPPPIDTSPNLGEGIKKTLEMKNE